VTTRKTIDSAQVIPLSGSRKVEKRSCHRNMTHEMAV
jgi:hypothetical protein